MESSEPITIVIPTFEREEALLQTLAALKALDPKVHEIIVVDQTMQHHRDTENQLRRWVDDGSIGWIRMKRPSIPAAMNKGLRYASHNLVLFLDDDVLPGASLLAGHVEAHQLHEDCWASVGQVIQPWQEPEEIHAPRLKRGLELDFDFPFHSTRDAATTNVMAGNLCVDRVRALSIGGFDEHFSGPAYRFETDFARRLIEAGGQIRFAGSASIRHLRARRGGTRSYGNHLTSASPIHGFGDYYYAFRHGTRRQAWAYSLRRLFREVTTRFHLLHPWWMPVKFVGELRALSVGRKTARLGPKLGCLGAQR